MYFRRLSKSSKWSITGPGLDLLATETETGISVCGNTFPNVESIMRFFGIGTTCTLLDNTGADVVLQFDTGDGETYKVRRQQDGLKLWGKSIKVTVFPTWLELFACFDQVYIKKAECFERPEYVCTDSKGKYVATVKQDGDNWTVEVEGSSSFMEADLNAAMEAVLLAL